MPETIVTTIDLMRHGACEGGEIFRGTTDVPLTEAGWQQMRQIAESEPGWTRIVSSGLMRCLRFAEELANERALPLLVEDRLREMHFGDWEGQVIEDVRRLYPDAWRAFFLKPATAAAPGGESMPELRSRVVPGIEAVVADNRGEHILVISHGAVIRAIICEWLCMPLDAITRLSVPYASLTRFRIFEMQGRDPWMQLCFHRGG